MENIKLLEELFDKKILKIIKLFLLNKEKTFYLQEISKESNVAIATVFRIIGKLKELGVVEEVHIKRFKIYRCASNDNVRFLESFIKEGKRIIDNFADIVGKIGGVEEVILHGKETEEKANILIIGSLVDSNEVKKVCNDFKEKYDYIVNYLTLEREQYNQMSAMGLYSGKKKTLFKRA